MIFFSLGGWDPTWDAPRKMYLLRPQKGHVRERNRPERAAKIENAMKGMSDRIRKYEQEVEDRKPNKDVFFMFKRIAELKGRKGGP